MNELFKKHFDRVEIEEDSGFGFTALIVKPYWKGVDRPCTGGTSCGYDRKLAERMKRGIEAGVVNPPVSVDTDVNGKTYVSTRLNVLGRCLNVDLKRLGF